MLLGIEAPVGHPAGASVFRELSTERKIRAGRNGVQAPLFTVRHPPIGAVIMWRQPSPERLELRHVIRHQIEQLLRGYYGDFQAEETPQRFVALLCEVDFVGQDSSAGGRRHHGIGVSV